MMISETTTEKTAPLSEAQQALADTLAKKWKKQTRIMLLAAVACTAAATGLIAAFPSARAAVLSVPVKYAQQITVRMAVGIAWKMLILTGIALLIAAMTVRQIAAKTIAREELLHSADGTDTEENRKSYRKAAKMRAASVPIRVVSALMLLTGISVGEVKSLFLLLLAPAFILLWVDKKSLKNAPLPETPAAVSYRRSGDIFSRLTRIAAVVVLVFGGVLLIFDLTGGFMAYFNRQSRNSMAHNIRSAIVNWQQECAEQGFPCELPADTGNLRGDDTDPDSLTQKIYPYFTNITKIGYFRVLSDENGSVTEVLISPSPITDISAPDPKEQQRLLSSVFTCDLAVGSAQVYDLELELPGF